MGYANMHLSTEEENVTEGEKQGKKKSHGYAMEHAGSNGRLKPRRSPCSQRCGELRCSTGKKSCSERHMHGQLHWERLGERQSCFGLSSVQLVSSAQVTSCCWLVCNVGRHRMMPVQVEKQLFAMDVGKVVCYRFLGYGFQGPSRCYC